MRNKYSVKLKTIAEEMELTPLHTSADYEQALIITADVKRPAMQLTGVYNYFDPHRLQIMGRVESTYLDTLSHEERLAAFRAGANIFTFEPILFDRLYYVVMLLVRGKRMLQRSVPLEQMLRVADKQIVDKEAPPTKIEGPGGTLV